MAFNQKSKRFGKFLDFIGLVDPEKEGESEYNNPSRKNAQRTAGRNTVPVDDGMDDLFDDVPPVSARRPAAGRSASSQRNASRYDNAEDWNERGSRVDYRNTSSRFGGAPSGRSSGGYGTSMGYENDGYRPSAGRSQARNMQSDFSVEGERRNPYRQAPSRPQPQNVPPRRDNDYDDYEQDASGFSDRQPEIMMKDVHTVNECKDVILALLAKKTVLVNLVAMNADTAQRVLDTLSGATFAIDAKIRRAADSTWLCTPKNVEVSDGPKEEADRRFY